MLTGFNFIQFLFFFYRVKCALNLWTVSKLIQDKKCNSVSHRMIVNLWWVVATNPAWEWASEINLLTHLLHRVALSVHLNAHTRLAILFLLLGTCRLSWLSSLAIWFIILSGKTHLARLIVNYVNYVSANQRYVWRWCEICTRCGVSGSDNMPFAGFHFMSWRGRRLQHCKPQGCQTSDRRFEPEGTSPAVLLLTKTG